MSDWEVELENFEAVVAELQEITIELDADAVYVTGSGVEYAVYQELGTRHMEPNPFLRPAVRDARRNMDQLAASATSANNLIKRIALYIERRAKHYATTGVPPGPDVDTNTLRSSIKARRVK